MVTILSAAMLFAAPPLVEAPIKPCAFDPSVMDIIPAGAARVAMEVAAGDDALGDAWEEEEVSCWRGIWLRRGKSDTFDGYWMNPSGERERAKLQMWSNGPSVIVIRRHSGGRYCRYDGLISADRTSVEGRYTCTWVRAPMRWAARIVRMVPN